MRRPVHTFIALVILLAIGVVCFAPSVDLEPTAIRAVEASLIFLALACVGQIVTRLALPTPGLMQVHATVCNQSTSPSDVSLIDLNCTRLC
jgi:hypothetical protein